MNYICVECGIITDDIRGSVKLPYCMMCFEKVWSNDEKKYVEWLADVHPYLGPFSHRVRFSRSHKS